MKCNVRELSVKFVSVTALATLGVVGSAHAAITTYSNFSTSTANHGFSTAANYTPSGVPDASTLVDVTSSATDQTYVGITASVPTASAYTLNVGALVFDSISTNASYTVRSSSLSTTSAATAEFDSTLALAGGNTGTTAGTTLNGSTTVTVPQTNAGDLIVLSSSLGGKTITFSGYGALDSAVLAGGTGNASVAGVNGSNLIVSVPTAGGNFNIASGNTLAFNNNTYTSSSGSKTYTATLSGSGNINVTGGGILRMVNSNSAFTGGFTVSSASTLSMSGANGIILGATPAAGAAPQVTLNGGTLLVTTTFGATPLGVARQIGLTTAAGSTISLSTGLMAIAGQIVDSGGSGSVSKTGSGVVAFANTETYTGSTTVSSGQLNVDGSIASSSGVSIASAATLGGVGTTSAVTTVSGSIVSPGENNTYSASTATGFTSSTGRTAAPIGTLSVAGLTMASGSIFNYDVDTTAGTNDFLAVTTAGGVSGNGGIFNLLVSGTTTPLDTAGTYSLISEVGGYTGGLSSLSIGNLPSDLQAAFSVGGTGNLQVTLSAVPEPVSVGMLGLGGIALLRRRRMA